MKTMAKSEQHNTRMGRRLLGMYACGERRSLAWQTVLLLDIHTRSARVPRSSLPTLHLFQAVASRERGTQAHAPRSWTSSQHPMQLPLDCNHTDALEHQLSTTPSYATSAALHNLSSAYLPKQTTSYLELRRCLAQAINSLYLWLAFYRLSDRPWNGLPHSL
jgi:hypothetical protein